MNKGHMIAPMELVQDLKDKVNNGTSVSAKDETITLSLENWILDESNNTYSQTVVVDGMTATSNPVVLLSGAADDPTDDEEESYACISSITTADDSITFVVDKMPKVSFNVIIKNVVNAEGGNDDVAELEERVDVLEAEVGNKVDTTDSRLSDARTPLEHNHDDKYYTESEIDSKFNTTNQNVTNNANAINQLNSDIGVIKGTVYLSTTLPITIDTYVNIPLPDGYTYGNIVVLSTRLAGESGLFLNHRSLLIKVETNGTQLRIATNSNEFIGRSCGVLLGKC